jgi:hypothetical protein
MSVLTLRDEHCRCSNDRFDEEPRIVEVRRWTGASGRMSPTLLGSNVIDVDACGMMK